MVQRPNIADDHYYRSLREQLTAAADNDRALLDAIVNAPFHDQLRAVEMGLGIIVLLLNNPETNTIDRVALSTTDSAQGAVRMSAKPFHDIRIPADHPHNIIVRTIQENEPQLTADWKYLFVPELSPREARMNQAGAGIEASVVYPLVYQPGGALIFSYFEPPHKIGPEQHEFMQHYQGIVSEHLSQLRAKE
jgi:hypothetical protein